MDIHITQVRDICYLLGNASSQSVVVEVQFEQKLERTNRCRDCSGQMVVSEIETAQLWEGTDDRHWTSQEVVAEIPVRPKQARLEGTERTKRNNGRPEAYKLERLEKLLFNGGMTPVSRLACRSNTTSLVSCATAGGMLPVN
jgi:hypothetical protein